MTDPWGISGPDFVVLYVGLLGAVLLVRVVVSGIAGARALRADHARHGAPPTVYQLAFLAGGPDRAADAAVAALVERGRLRVNSYKQVSQAGALQDPALPLLQCVNPLFLHRTRHRRHVIIDEEGIEDDDRQRAEKRARHQRAPFIDVAAHQLGQDADRHGLVLG